MGSDGNGGDFRLDRGAQGPDLGTPCVVTFIVNVITHATMSSICFVYIEMATNAPGRPMNGPSVYFDGIDTPSSEPY